MNYYDEEIIIAGPDTKSLGAIKVNRLASRSGSSSGSRAAAALDEQRDREIMAGASGRRSHHIRQLNAVQSVDDDGLLQDIIDHDDEDDTEDSDMQNPTAKPSGNRNSGQQTRRSAAQQRPTSVMRRPPSSRFTNLPTGKVMDNDSEQTDTESDEASGMTPGAADTASVNAAAFVPPKARIPSATGVTAAITKQASSNEEQHTTPQLDITPDKWEQLGVHEEIKELFPYILKYTPQHIETPYHLQPFLPEYVPAVGDVDAFLKVTNPRLLKPQRQQEIDEHLSKLGLYFLDEPSGEQSQPSLLNMKLRSVLTGSGVNPRLASAALIPTAKTAKDIDKWIAEVEQVHMTQSVHDVQPRKDIEPLLLDWPREYARAAPATQDAYQRCLQNDITLADYIRILSESFGVEGPLETQADYILNVQTLFALYLAANQAWE